MAEKVQGAPSMSKGPKELRKEVLDAGRCTACGMCLGLCPYLDEMGENVAFVADCRGETGRCYSVCPRTPTDLDALRGRFVPGGREDLVLGRHQAVWMSRAAREEVRREGQYGGTVTALALFGLATGRADAALLTRWSTDPEEPYLPEPLVARTAEEVLSAAGSKYTSSPTLRVLDATLRGDVERLFLVGRPCQVLALRKRMQIDDATFPAERISLVVGLFCMWSLPYRDLGPMLDAALGGAPATRVDVPRGRFMATSARGSAELDHDKVRSHARATCQSCYDFTSELADLSVGSTEWKEDWNTLIIRTEAGRAYVEAARDDGWLELEPFPEERIRLLREAAFNKKQRVLASLEEARRQKGQAPYVQISREERDFFLREGSSLPGE